MALLAGSRGNWPPRKLRSLPRSSPVRRAQTGRDTERDWRFVAAAHSPAAQEWTIAPPGRGGPKHRPAATNPSAAQGKDGLSRALAVARTPHGRLPASSTSNAVMAARTTTGSLCQNAAIPNSPFPHGQRNMPKSTSPPRVRLELYFRRGLTHHGTTGPMASRKLRKRLTQRRETASIPALFFWHSRREPVAHPADRMDVPRSLRVIFQLLAQPGDVHVDGPG